MTTYKLDLDEMCNELWDAGYDECPYNLGFIDEELEKRDNQLCQILEWRDGGLVALVHWQQDGIEEEIPSYGLIEVSDDN